MNSAPHARARDARSGRRPRDGDARAAHLAIAAQRNASAPAPVDEHARARSDGSEPVPAVEDGGERVEERRGLVGEPLGNALQVAGDDRRRDSEQLRKRAPRAVGVRRRAEVRVPVPAVFAGAAGARHPGHDALAEDPAGPRLSPTATTSPQSSWPIVTGSGMRRVPAREQLQVRAAGQRRPHAQDDLAGARARARELALLEPADRRLDERSQAYFLRSPTKRARSGSRPPRSGRTAHRFDRLLDLLGEHRARALDAPDPGNVALPAAASLPERLAERRGVRLDVEQVVLDLEREADPLAVEVESAQASSRRRRRGCRRRRARRGSAGPSCSRGSRATSVLRRRGSVLGLEVRDLAADHAARADRFDDRLEHPHLRRRELAPLRVRARSARGRGSAARLPRGSPSPRRRRRGRSARRAAGRRCRARAGRRGSASRCGSSRGRRPARGASSSVAAERVSPAARQRIGRSRLPPAKTRVADGPVERRSATRRRRAAAASSSAVDVRAAARPG